MVKTTDLVLIGGLLIAGGFLGSKLKGGTDTLREFFTTKEFFTSESERVIENFRESFIELRDERSDPSYVARQTPDEILDDPDVTVDVFGGGGVNVDVFDGFTVLSNTEFAEALDEREIFSTPINEVKIINGSQVASPQPSGNIGVNIPTIVEAPLVQDVIKTEEVVEGLETGTISLKDILI